MCGFVSLKTSGAGFRCWKAVRKYRDRTGTRMSTTRKGRLGHGAPLQRLHRMLAAQGGRCAICASDMGTEWQVDHDHATGKVRGLLCSPCNRGLGLFKDAPHLLRSAISYLTKSPGSALR